MLMLKLAFRNILRNKRRTILTMLSMFGGYFLMVFSLSVQMGSYEQIIDFFTRDATGHVQISEVGYQDKPTLYKNVPNDREFYEELIAIDGVERATSRIVSGALAYGEVKSFPVQVIGVDVQREAELSFITGKVRDGNYFTEGPDADGYFQAMIGGAVAQQLKLSVGDELILVSQGSDGSMANDIYLVSAVLGTKESAEARNVYLPMAAAQDFFVMQNKAHFWAVLTDNYQNSEALETRLNDWLSAESNSIESVTWKIVSKEFYEAMQADIEGGYVAYYVIVFLVCIGVLNTVLMSVLERTGEFGVLKAIGTSPLRLFSLIVIETMMLAILSCVAGFIAVIPLNIWLAGTGFAIPEPVEFSGVVMSHMQGTWNPSVFIEPAVIILVSTLLVSLIPARRAARIVPVDAMRGL